MYQIFIVEDDTTSLRTLTGWIDQFSRLHNELFSTRSFCDGERLLSSIKRVIPDLVILDIDLPNISGIEIARRLRLHFPNLCIIFNTKFHNFAYEAFSLHANGFIGKSTTYQEFDYHFSHYLSQIRQKKEQESKDTTAYFSFMKNGEHFQIPYQNILYFEKYRNRIEIITTYETLDFYSSMKELISELPSSYFMLANQGIIVNLMNVKMVSHTQVQLVNGTIKQVSESKRKPLIKAFTELKC